MNDYLNIVPEFLKESLDSINRFEKRLPKIVEKIERGKISFLKDEENLFRAVHSISGGSSFLGLGDIERISLWLEKLLFVIKDEKVPADSVSASLVDSLFKLIKEALANNGKVKKRVANKIEKQVSKFFESIKDKVEERPVTIDLDGKEFSFSIDLKEIEKKLEKKGLYILSIDPIADLDENRWVLTDFISELLEHGDILDSVIDIENVYEDSIPVSVLYLCDISDKKLRNKLKDLPQEKIVLIDRNTSKRIFNLENRTESRKDVEKNLEESSPSKIESYQDYDGPVEEAIQEKENEEEREFVSFLIGKEYYAVSIKDVFDMKEMLPCSRIPNQPDHMLGVMNLRGNVVPVIDLRLLMGKKKVTYDEFSVFLIVKVNNKITGCVVDAIDDVVFLEPEDTQITPATSRQINIDYVKFIAKDSKTGRFLIVLDLEKMLINE